MDHVLILSDVAGNVPRPHAFRNCERGVQSVMHENFEQE